ncbi:hypothetical protein [Deinococcus aquaedulcis]|uniref:hypothetical protein n=1 Tax=Deinococcus aquaedulcis TaxID=2840455 RepID=UPI001C83561D|nr:hypothetical protein [Deinococcus aquaedulcis]
MKGLQAWINRVCTGGCTAVSPATLLKSHGEQLLPGGKVLLVRRGQDKFYLAYDLGIYNQQLDLSQIAFFPVRLQDRWTARQLAVVANWMEDLAGGQANGQKLSDCVASLKRNNYVADLLGTTYGPGSLGILQLDDIRTAQGKCYWIGKRKNVAFGFGGLGLR